MSVSIQGFALAAVVLLAALIGWAARERARIHRQWSRGRRAVESMVALPAADWWITFDVAAGCL